MTKKHSITTAARSRDYMRGLGYTADQVEHHQGPVIRVDLFGFADVMAYKPGEGIILIQAYSAKDKYKHEELVPGKNATIKDFMDSGGRFQHHIWRKEKFGDSVFNKVEIIEFKGNETFINQGR